MYIKSQQSSNCWLFLKKVHKNLTKNKKLYIIMMYMFLFYEMYIDEEHYLSSYYDCIP